MIAIFDTNILIDYLNGREEARQELLLYQNPHISIITWMEVLIGTAKSEEQLVRGFLQRFIVADINLEISERTIDVRKNHKPRLPDAIIWATAEYLDAMLVTRDEKAFPVDKPWVRIPYQINNESRRV